MTDRQVPRMMRGGLSGRIYVVTRYRDLGNGSVEALQKYDVTEQFDATFHVDHERAVKAEAQIAAVVAWTMVNEIAAGPLDWKGLGAILNPALDDAATMPTGFNAP